MTCTHRRYKDEPTARRCLWALGQQGRINHDRLCVKRCRECRGWRIVRRK